MSNNSGCFQDRVAKLHSLRKKLLRNESPEWTAGFEVRDFVVHELQDMYKRLSKPDTNTTPEWCREKVGHILDELLSVPETKTTGD